MEFAVAADASRRSAGMSDRRKAAGTARPWAFLSPELLADVYARLHDAADFVRFHAVCAPWRNAAPSMLSPETPPRTSFLPWLVVSQSSGRIVHSPVLYSGRISPEPRSKHRHRGHNGVLLAEPGTLPAGSDRNLVGSADGQSVWILCWGHQPTLLDLATRAVRLLPPFPIEEDEMMSNPRGIVSGDGTVFLYCFDSDTPDGYSRHRTLFRAAILRPGDTLWTVVEKGLCLPASPCHSCAAYQGGKVLVWMGAYFWCLLTPDFEAHSPEATDGMLETTWDRLEDEYYERDHSYVMESRGELLWASILVGKRREYNARPTIAVRVHALEEEETDGSSKMHWVEKDDRSLGDRVLFLGSPASFAMDATELGVEGGCAYFVFNGRVHRYNFVDGEVEPVESMLGGRVGSNETRLWLRPQQPGLASVLKIQERLGTRNTKNLDGEANKAVESNVVSSQY